MYSCPCLSGPYPVLPGPAMPGLVQSLAGPRLVLPIFARSFPALPVPCPLLPGPGGAVPSAPRWARLGSARFSTARPGQGPVPASTPGEGDGGVASLQGRARVGGVCVCTGCACRGANFELYLCVQGGCEREGWGECKEGANMQRVGGHRRYRRGWCVNVRGACVCVQCAGHL